MDDQDRHEEGMRVRRAVLGSEHVDRSIVNTTDFTAPFQDFITRYAWGEVWTRPGLDRRARSMITLALLTALGQERELGMHVAGALRNGLTREQVQEVLLHCAVYAGVPAANRAFAVAQRVFEKLDDQVPEPSRHDREEPFDDVGENAQTKESSRPGSITSRPGNPGSMTGGPLDPGQSA